MSCCLYLCLYVSLATTPPPPPTRYNLVVIMRATSRCMHAHENATNYDSTNHVPHDAVGSARRVLNKTIVAIKIRPRQVWCCPLPSNFEYTPCSSHLSQGTVCKYDAIRKNRKYITYRDDVSTNRKFGEVRTCDEIWGRGHHVTLLPSGRQ